MTERYVLIVDDDPDARLILKIILTRLGWQAQEASSGQEALDHVVQSPPGIIFLDLMMPGMNGFEVLSHFKRNTETRNIPVIIVSAMGSDQRLERLGAAGVLAKGRITPDRVKQILAEFLPLAS